ncbi:MAG: NAD(P)H-dependent oxidoreductase [Eubacterium sp.]|nr:NAD(P)H-dependent oxidoreductase [Eubacterium sp.]
MKNILYINACVREESRTALIADAYLKKAANEENTVVNEVKLEELDIKPLDGKLLEMRNQLHESENLDNEFFQLARQFANADEIVVAAPYWDLSFPALLKTYVENICVTGITFYYGENGIPVGLCKAKKLTYVTTAGGYIGDFNMGFDYIRNLSAGLFNIPDINCIKAEGLDIFGADVEKIIEETIKEEINV